MYVSVVVITRILKKSVSTATFVLKSAAKTIFNTSESETGERS